MPEISFCPQTQLKLEALIQKGLFSGYGLVIFPHETTGHLRAEFITMPVIVALQAKPLSDITPTLQIYTFGLEPLPENVTLRLAFEAARPNPDQDLPELALGFPMSVQILPEETQSAQAS